MNFNFIKSHWKLISIVVGTVIFLFLIGSITGTNRKLYSVILDQLTTDKDRIVKQQADLIESLKGEKSKLVTDKAEAEKQKASALRRAAESDAKAAEKEGRIHELEEKLRDINISSDPDALVQHLQSYGIGIHYRR
jgi:hypothetical protein